MVDVEGKGRGIVATKHFSKGDFICEYSGELTTEDTARCREVDYQKDCLIGCYMYYFMYNGKKYWLVSLCVCVCVCVCVCGWVGGWVCMCGCIQPG